jgi:hypothetical protein
MLCSQVESLQLPENESTDLNAERKVSDDVASLFLVAQHPASGREQPAADRSHDLGVRLGIAVAQASEQVLLGIDGGAGWRSGPVCMLASEPFSDRAGAVASSLLRSL